MTKIFLAPMAGFTDTAFRILIRSLGCKSLLFSEMISAAGLHYRNEKTLSMLKTFAQERPLSIQIFGSEPAICAEAAAYIEQLQIADALDFNAGCPVPKIVRNGEGSALLKNPAHLEKILSAIKKAVRIPVSVKIRLGFDSINAVEVSKRVESAGVDFITVHGRTRSQFYSGVADWNEIARVKSAVKIPVIANGDVHDFASLDKILSTTHADGVMIGRAARGNPQLITQLQNYLETGEKIPEPTLQERTSIMRRHLENLIRFKGTRVALFEMRTHAAFYVKGLPCAAELRNSFNRAATADEFFNLIEVING